MKHARFSSALVLAAFGAPMVHAADSAAPVDLQQQVEQLQSAIDGLKAQLEQQQQQDAALKQAHAQQQAQIESLADQAERSSVVSKAQIGGYGEMHYNNLDSKRELDFHRFVLYFGYDFSDRIRFASELEFEHAFLEATEVDVETDPNSGDIEAIEVERTPGEVELEQAYLEFGLPARQQIKGGLFLVPVGILNETHEPTTFYGVERNIVESAIIPTTWREGGAVISGPIAETGLSYDFAVHSGLKLDDNFMIRSGRQHVAEAVANDLAYTARLRYAGIPGVQIAGSLQYQTDAAQGLTSETISAVLTEAHAIIEKGPFSARVLWAGWQLDGEAPKAVNRDGQDGYYAETAYRVLPAVGIFARYSAVDTGGTADVTEVRQTNVGINWWPHKDVVLKADIQDQDNAADNDGFNLGIGYRF